MLVRDEEKMVLFWRTSDIYSNWHPSEFKIDGVKYYNVEQYMMAEKARLFKDAKTLSKIMKTKNPSEIKKLGREVDGYRDEQWVKRRFDVVCKACYAKFTQNKDLGDQLLATGDYTIVEASPSDSIWGIGLEENDPRAWCKSKWLGQNLLGKALMHARSQMKNKK